MKKDELKQKILQTLIFGYEGEQPPAKLWELIPKGLGGIIFFAENIKIRNEFKSLIKRFKKLATIPLFFSTDQEGGLVERTIFLDIKNEYLTPKAISRLENQEYIKNHYELMAIDLRDLGINFNLAPVLDVNTNPNNPIIGVRSFGNNPFIVNKCSQIAINAFKNIHIFSCAKHFAGHGDTEIDSHKKMPRIAMEYEKFYKNHLVCFEYAIQNNIDAIMVSHIHFPFFDEVKTPASLSQNAIEIYLKSILKFKGLILTDDMVMGGITENYGLKESIILALKAGIDILIFRNITNELIETIDEIAQIACEDKELQNKINTAYEKIVNFKNKNLVEFCPIPLQIKENQQIIDKIAEKTIKIDKKSDILPLQKEKKYTIIAFNTKEIYNLSANHNKLSDFLPEFNVKELSYPLDPNEDEIDKITQLIDENTVVIFLSYNAHIHKGQLKLFEKIKTQKILVSCALDYDIKLFGGAESIISLCCFKNPSLKGLAKILSKNYTKF